MALPSNSPPEHDDAVDVAVVESNKSTSALAPAKKRRRRTTAGGATDDCFSCRRHGARCDRKRPYCSQCIDAGKECSGYKTTLTWGVGVASRGKLRGLACPVANKHVDGSDLSPSEMDARRRRSLAARTRLSTSSTSYSHSSRPATMLSPTSQPPVEQAHATPTYAGEVHRHAFSHPIPIPNTQHSWRVLPDHGSISPQHESSPMSHPSLQFLETAGFHALATSLGSYDNDYQSSAEYPCTPDSMAFSDHLATPALNVYPDHPFFHRNSIDAYSTDGLSSTPVHSELPLFSPTHFEPSSLEMASYAHENRYDGLDTYAQHQHQHQQQQQQQLEGEYDNSRANVQWFDSRFSGSFPHLSPRLQSLMNYYDKHVCPHLVTFDGPNNPYRSHILRLAMQDDSLQNALAALATNNIRMRRREAARRLTYCDSRIRAFHAVVPHETDVPSPEEQLYKQLSVDHLNARLVNVNVAEDDGVLATLLVLCLFHVCDSGVSKFKTQLAGMQKLLSLRDPNTVSDYTRWIQMFFTWFDVMTSTVNDRETQVKPESLDMLDSSTNLGALEQFSGCEGRLFKLISRLGRLNLLAQGRPVVDEDPTLQPPQSFCLASPEDSLGRYYAPRPLTTFEFEKVDGNGWSTPISRPSKPAAGAHDAIHSEARAAFWADWHDVRARLEAWRMDDREGPAAPDALANPATLDIAQGDLLHINECFRLAALLYTERLAQPSLESMHDQFQIHVTRALQHFTALPVTSCVNKFLLWPLFMIGTETVTEDHRNIIRSRCTELTRESGFFNNLSCLEVLEKVWANKDGSENCIPLELASAQPFHWRHAMGRMDGEYIIV